MNRPGMGSSLVAKRSALNETHGPERPLPRKLRHGWELRSLGNLGSSYLYGYGTDHHVGVSSQADAPRSLLQCRNDWRFPVAVFKLVADARERAG